MPEIDVELFNCSCVNVLEPVLGLQPVVGLSIHAPSSGAIDCVLHALPFLIRQLLSTASENWHIQFAIVPSVQCVCYKHMDCTNCIRKHWYSTTA